MTTERIVYNSSTALNSIDVSRNAKGEHSWSVKLYFMENGEAEALKKMEKIHKELRKKFVEEK